MKSVDAFLAGDFMNNILCINDMVIFIVEWKQDSADCDSESKLLPIVIVRDLSSKGGREGSNPKSKLIIYS